MDLDLQTFFTSSIATRSAMWVGRNIPRPVALALARLSTSLISRRSRSPLVRSIRLNQSVARDLSPDAPELDAVVRRVLYNAGRGYYESYNRIARGREVVHESFTFGPELFTMLHDAKSTGRGIVVVAPHLGNLDLGLAGFAAEGYDIQAITYEAAPGGYQVQNRLREGSGYIVTPADAGAARMAFERLRRGGIVLTGVDRPLPNGASMVRFFGRPAPLPTGYVRLALSTGSLFFVVWLESVGGRYCARAAGPIDLVRTGSRSKDAVVNAEKVLEIAEEKIRAQPDEWMMFHPVWPQLMPN